MIKSLRLIRAAHRGAAVLLPFRFDCAPTPSTAQPCRQVFPLLRPAFSTLQSAADPQRLQLRKWPWVPAMEGELLDEPWLKARWVLGPVVRPWTAKAG